MKTHRFENALPLSGGRRKRQNNANSRVLYDNETGYEHADDTRDIIDLGRHFPGVVSSLDSLTGAGSVLSDSRFSRIRRNIADGYYNSPEFIEKLADTLIEKLRLAGGNK